MAGRVNEGSVAVYSGQLVDEDGEDILLSSIVTLTLTLYDLLDGTIINSRNAVNALNANNVTVGTTGLITFSMLPADNPVLHNTLDTETHTILFKCTFGAGGAKAVNHDFSFRVVNLAKVS